MEIGGDRLKKYLGEEGWCVCVGRVSGEVTGVLIRAVFHEAVPLYVNFAEASGNVFHALLQFPADRCGLCFRSS